MLNGSGHTCSRDGSGHACSRGSFRPAPLSGPAPSFATARCKPRSACGAGVPPEPLSHANPLLGFPL